MHEVGNLVVVQAKQQRQNRGQLTSLHQILFLIACNFTML